MLLRHYMKGRARYNGRATSVAGRGKCTASEGTIMKRQTRLGISQIGVAGFAGLLTIAFVVLSKAMLAGAEADSEVAEAEKTLKDAGLAVDDAALLKFFKDRIISDDDL